MWGLNYVSCLWKLLHLRLLIFLGAFRGVLLLLWRPFCADLLFLLLVSFLWSSFYVTFYVFYVDSARISDCWNSSARSLVLVSSSYLVTAKSFNSWHGAPISLSSAYLLATLPAFCMKGCSSNCSTVARASGLLSRHNQMKLRKDWDQQFYLIGSGSW